MTSAMPYWHVDAFADRPFAGNPAAVMILETWLPDATLQAIAAENLFPATAFAVTDPTGAADWELRWFTPGAEIRLCGHATLASGHVLLGRAKGSGPGERVTFSTGEAGVLEVNRAARGGYELALPAIRTQPHDRPEAVLALGGRPVEIERNPGGYTILRYAHETEIRALEPDMPALAALGGDQFICTAPGVSSDVVSRVFVPGRGIDEDSVTGSAHAALTPFWAARLGRDRFTAHQASARGGDLTCRLNGERAWLGGECVTVAEGTFYLSG